MKRSLFYLALAVSGTIPFGVQAAAWTYSSPTAVGACGPLDSASGTGADSATGFLVSPVVGQADARQPMKMAFVMNADTARKSATAKTNIIFVQREGAVKWYESKTGVVTTIGTIPNVGTATEDGLTGIAVERVFKNRIYVQYAYKPAGSSAANTVISGSFRVSRFDLDPVTHMMDMNSEKILLEAPSFRNRWHTAGAMTMDNAGNLYIAIGDNETAFTGPANTHSYIGSILRIHPNDNGIGYTIPTTPTKNFAEHYADQFQAAGRSTLAAQYRDTSKVRPEIYVKGNRNPYTVAVNPVSGQLVYSQCGADNQPSNSPSESQNITNTATFAGWPFWIGAGKVTNTQTGGSQYGKNGANEPVGTAAWDAAAPAAGDSLNPVIKWTNGTSVSMGVDTLPKYRRSTYTYLHSGYTCAMGAMIYKYDGTLANPNKLPPQMDNVWIIGDWSQRALRAAKVDSAGNLVGAFSSSTNSTSKFLSAWSANTTATIRSLVDLQQGPDGAIYVMNYMNGTGTSANVNADGGTGIARIELKSNSPAACSDAALTALSRPMPAARGSVTWLTVGTNSFSVYVNGAHQIQIADAQGKVVSTMNGNGIRDYNMPSNLRSGIYFLRVKTNEGLAVRGFTRL